MLLTFKQWNEKIKDLDSHTGEDESEKYELERNILIDWEEERIALLNKIKELTNDKNYNEQVDLYGI